MFHDRRRRSALFVLSLSVGSLVGVVALGAAPAGAGSATTKNACFSNATATYSDLDWTLTGSAAPATAASGDTVTLSGSTVQVNIPATLLVAGYNLGLLSVGSNNIPTKVWVARSASNATPGVQVDNLDLTATTTITDPNGTPGTGDETATPLSVSKPLPNMVVTATGGNIAFAQAAPGTLPQIPAGVAGVAAVQPKGSLFATASVAGGLVRANFDCFPGKTIIDPPGGTSGKTFTPATPASFATVTVGGSGTSSTTTTTDPNASTSTTTTTTAPGSTTTTTAPSSTTTTTTPVVADAPVTGTATYDADCTNNVTPDKSVLTFAVTGTAPGQVQAGAPVKLSDQSWKITVPGSVLDTGIGLELLSAGQTVSGTAVLSVFARNTVEGTVASAPVPIQVGPIELGGDGKALPASTTVDVPDMVWTATGGTVGYAMDATTVEVVIGPLKVKFSCAPQNEALAIVETAVSGSSGVKPGGRTQVAGETTTRNTSLPRTGFGPVAFVLLAVILLDLGYLMRTATVPVRRRT